MLILDKRVPNRNSLLKLQLLALVGHLSLFPASACIHPYPLDADDFFAKSDVVALADLKSKTWGSQPGRVSMAAIAVHCFKGCVPGEPINFIFEGCDAGVPGALGKPVVLFAKRDGESLRTVDQDALWASPAISRLPAAPSLIGNGNGLYGLQESLLFLVTNEETSVRMDALRWLSEFSSLSPTVRVSMRQMAANEEEPLAKRVAALGVLMRQSQPHDVKIAAGLAVRHGTELADPAYTSVTRLVGFPGNPQMLDSLITIATASGTPPPWRSSALWALRELRTPAAIPAFMLALDSPNERVQFGAVMALAELTGKSGEEYGPGPIGFSRNPGYATEHWKAWWRDEGKHFYEARMQPGSEKSIDQRK